VRRARHLPVLPARLDEPLDPAARPDAGRFMSQASAYAADLRLIAPEVLLTLVALAVLVWDLVLRRRHSYKVGYLTLGGLVVTGWLLVAQWSELGAGGPRTVFGMVTLDRFGTFFKLFTVGALGIVTLFVLHDRRERKHGVGEYYFLLLGAALGIFFMVST